MIKNKLSVQNILWTAIIIAVALLNIYPFIWLIIGSFWHNGVFSIQNFKIAITSFDFGKIFLNTWIYALGSTIVGLVLGIFAALAVTRTNMPAKKFIKLASTIGFVSPPWINAMGYVFLLSPQAGLINKFLENVIGYKPFNIYSMGGMIFVSGLFIFSLVFIIISSALENIDSTYEEASLISGASPVKTIFRITLPLITPSIITATIFSIIVGWAIFTVPAILGIPADTYFFQHNCIY